MSRNLTITKKVPEQRRGYKHKPLEVKISVFEDISNKVAEAMRTSDLPFNENVNWILNSIYSMGEEIMQVMQARNSSSVDTKTYVDIIGAIFYSLTGPGQQLETTISTIQNSLKELTTEFKLIEHVLERTKEIYQAAEPLYKGTALSEDLMRSKIFNPVHNLIQTYPVTFYTILALGFINQINHTASHETILNAFLEAVEPYIQQELEELANTQTHLEPSHAQENYEELLEKLGISIEPIDSVYTPEASYRRQNTIQIRFPKGCAKKCKESIRDDLKSISHALLKQLRKQSLGSHPLASLPKALKGIANAKRNKQEETLIEDLIEQFSNFALQRVLGGSKINAIDNISQIIVKPITEQQDDRHTVTDVVLEIYGNNKGLRVVIRETKQ